MDMMEWFNVIAGISSIISLLICKRSITECLMYCSNP